MSASNSSCIIRTYKFRLFPNVNQTRELESTLETHRRLYNQVLDGKMLCWEVGKVDWSYKEQSSWLTIQRKLNPYYARLTSSSAALTLRKLWHAYQEFYRRVKAGRLPGFPRFKSRDGFHSFSFREHRGRIDGCQFIDGKLRLQNIGTIRVRWHRELPGFAKLKQLRIMQRAGKWYACFYVELPKPFVATSKPASVGIDVGLKSFVTTSDGESLGDSRSLERVLPELRRRQRALSRCKRDSKRRQKVKRRVVALHAKVRESRQDMHHKVARSLVDRYGVIAAESLNVLGMLKNRRLARRISDAGWSGFLGILASKAESAGGRVVLVDPKNTSQACSSCGVIVRKSLAVRVHKCECGCVLDRDVNAAMNVLARAAPGQHNADSLRAAGSLLGNKRE